MSRKQKTIHYLYKTTCLVTGRYYIGMHSTNNLEDGYMGSGKRLRYSLRKHGVDNHKKEILEFFETRELLIEAEKRVITDDMIADVNCMNIMSGGTGGFISVEQQRHRSSCGGKAHAMKMMLDEDYRNKVIERNKLSLLKHLKSGKHNFKTFSGKKHSETTKEKISKTKLKQGIGETNSQYGTCWITKDGVNKKIKKEDLDTFIQDGWVKGRNT
jgi:hypothetical protein